MSETDTPLEEPEPAEGTEAETPAEPVEGGETEGDEEGEDAAGS